MPSAPKKRKSKQKNKVSASPPHQSWLLSHMQMLKAPSFGNGTKGKEKHYLAEKEAKGSLDRKEREEKASFLFKVVETSAGGKMDALEIEGSRLSSISTEIAQSDSENPLNLDGLKMSPLEKSRGELQEAKNLESAASNEFPKHSVNIDVKAESNGGLEEKFGEDKDIKKVEVDNSFADAISSQREASLPAIEVVETGEAVVDKAEVTPVLEAKESIHGKEDKLTVDADESMEASENDKIEAVTPKIEIPHPPIVVRRASVWNCCGLLEVLKTF